MNKRVTAQQLASTEQETQPLDDSRYEDLPRSEYLQLPQEEQDRLYELRQQRVREAPTLYEWDIRVATVYGMGWLAVLIPCGMMVLIGLVTRWYGFEQWYFFFIIVMIFGPFTRYLWLADKQYHYRLTTEGLIETEHDAIPDVAYAVVRGLAWFGVVVCIVGVAFLGPAALVGAGGMALGAVFFTGFKNVESTFVVPFNIKERYMMKATRNRSFVRCEEGVHLPNQCSMIEFYCSPDDQQNLMSILRSQLICDEIRLFKNELKLKLSPFNSLDTGEPAQLADFAPDNLHDSRHR